MSSFLLLFSLLSSVVLADVVNLHWNITWVTAAPDGFARPVIGINGQWPCPELRAKLGDQVIVTIDNQLGNQSTGLHWHGIHQTGTSYMDGASGVSQCPVAPGQQFTYNWTADAAGTYWYHSHDMGQYPDGLWGPLIIEDPNPPFEYDEEIILTLSDWYHEQSADLISAYQSPSGEALDGVAPPSGGALMNSGKNITIHVKPNKTYFIRVICPASYPGHAWLFQDHNQTTVEVDGTYVQPKEANGNGLLTRIAPGQRQGVLIKTFNDTSKNYAIWDTMDVNMLFINKGIIPPPMNYNTNVTGWLVYNESAPLPDPPVFYSLGNANFFDDLDYVPLDEEPLLEPVDHQIVLDTNSVNISGISRFEINNYTYLPAKVPSFYSAITTGNYSSDPEVYGHVNPIVVKKGEIIEIVINNLNTNLHPWHMHGHQFQVLDRPDPMFGKFNGTFRTGYPHAAPVRRDTFMLQDQSWGVIRFKADNPGVWLLHCHIEAHTSSGFVATIIEAPEELAQTNFRIPQDHIDACKTYPMKYFGNAAGNIAPTNLTGANVDVPSYDYGAMYPPGTPPPFKR
ncbi:hypothetical protein BT63DRAFT_432740 [Microthyrium microscopicum]|uniref:Multicopper oxidase n=1 Tax=Microthyrium microscopicum TaxID=703497 RepID=A0A6A6UE10_9PEZI|nr:hypothetical protein BT63DRAFT_432740 [Microthyrium microscopicum]